MNETVKAPELTPEQRIRVDAFGIHAPLRIQLSRRKGWRKPENTVVVARPTEWGNPYVVREFEGEWAVGMIWADGIVWVGSEGTRDAAFKKMLSIFRSLAATWPVEELRGKNLACWCKPGDWCHADVLLELANDGAA